MRWWSIRQPGPVEAFTLQGKIAAAVGDAGAAAIEALFLSPDQHDDVAGDAALFGEALAMHTLRRSRAGRPIMDLQDRGDVLGAQDRLWAVLAFAGKRAGGKGGMDVATLLGTIDRDREGNERWTSPSLLIRLLLASELQFDGEAETGPRPTAVDLAKLGPRDGDQKAAGELRQAVVERSAAAFARALDVVLASPDELALLAAWAVLHLYRPF
jgi:hypothetical protein